jgi:hypothetical protein
MSGLIIQSLLLTVGLEYTLDSDESAQALLSQYSE